MEEQKKTKNKEQKQKKIKEIKQKKSNTKRRIKKALFKCIGKKIKNAMDEIISSKERPRKNEYEGKESKDLKK